VLRKYNVKLILGYKTILPSTKNKIVVMFVKVGRELGDTSTFILWDTIATDPDRAYVQKKQWQMIFCSNTSLFIQLAHCLNVYTTLSMHGRNEVRCI